MTADPVVQTMFAVLALFEKKRVAYMLMGGLASRTWGLPRATFDVDFTLAMGPDQVAPFCSGLEKAGFSVPEIHLKGFADTLQGMLKFSFQDVRFPRPVPVDIFLVTTPYQREAFSRRRQMAFDGRMLWMISPEDLILHKLIAGRHKDLSDIDDVLLVQGQVDRAYLRKWADALGVTGLLLERLPGG